MVRNRVCENTLLFTVLDLLQPGHVEISRKYVVFISVTLTISMLAPPVAPPSARNSSLTSSKLRPKPEEKIVNSTNEKRRKTVRTTHTSTFSICVHCTVLRMLYLVLLEL